MIQASLSLDHIEGILQWHGINRRIYATAELADKIQQKIENHFRSLSLYLVHYDFFRIHETVEVTPAIAAGLTDTLHEIE